MATKITAIAYLWTVEPSDEWEFDKKYPQKYHDAERIVLFEEVTDEPKRIRDYFKVAYKELVKDTDFEVDHAEFRYNPLYHTYQIPIFLYKMPSFSTWLKTGYITCQYSGDISEELAKQLLRDGGY